MMYLYHNFSIRLTFKNLSFPFLIENKCCLIYNPIKRNINKTHLVYYNMEKNTLKKLQIIAWGIGVIALLLLVYGIIRALLS